MARWAGELEKWENGSNSNRHFFSNRPLKHPLPQLKNHIIQRSHYSWLSLSPTKGGNRPNRDFCGAKRFFFFQVPHKRKIRFMHSRLKKWDTCHKYMYHRHSFIRNDRFHGKCTVKERIRNSFALAHYK